MMHKIVVLKGDGIGPEVIDSALQVLNEVANRFELKLEFNEGLIGAASIKENGIPLTDVVVDLCKAADAILLGAIGDPIYDNSPDLAIRPEQGLLKLRKELELYANIRPVKAYDFLLEKSPLKNERIQGADIVIYRELIGGIYFGAKGMKGDTAFDHCEYDTASIDRILKLAFEAAMGRRKKLTVVDKANVLETSRLWRKRANLIKDNYPEIELDFLFVDNAAMQLILNPKQFDVVVTENMFGDILSDEASVIAGSIGLLPSSSIGVFSALFEPIHGSFPQAKGKNSANPVASILSVAMLLDHLGESDAADLVRKAVVNSLENGIMTGELQEKSNYGTREVTEFMVEFIQKSRETEIAIS